MKRIPDLHYVVVRAVSVFTRSKHLTVFYRHDKDGRAYIYHVEPHWGEDGRKTRAQAMRYGRCIVMRRTNLPLRELFIASENKAAVRAAGLDPDYNDRTVT